AIIYSNRDPNGLYIDKLIRVKNNKKIPFKQEIPEPFKTINDILNHPDIFVQLKRDIPHRRKEAPFHITFNSDFFKEILQDKKWTDIESEYFNYLTEHTVTGVIYNSKFIGGF